MLKVLYWMQKFMKILLKFEEILTRRTASQDLQDIRALHAAEDRLALPRGLGLQLGDAALRPRHTLPAGPHARWSAGAGRRRLLTKLGRSLQRDLRGFSAFVPGGADSYLRSVLLRSARRSRKRSFRKLTISRER